MAYRARAIKIEEFASALHEAGREAVVQGATVAAEKFGDTTRSFIEWDDLTEQAKEGRYIQARYLWQRFFIYAITEVPE